MHENTRDRLIAARDTNDFVPFLTEAIEGSDEVLLAYVLGHVDAKSTGYVGALNAVIRRLVTDALNLNEIPKTADDYQDPAATATGALAAVRDDA
jgi:hypothetical protein